MSKSEILPGFGRYISMNVGGTSTSFDLHCTWKNKIASPFSSGHLSLSSRGVATAVSGKYIMRKILSGPAAPILQPEFFVGFKRDDLVFAQAQKEEARLKDKTPPPELLGPEELNDFAGFMKALLLTDGFSLVYKPLYDVRGNGVFFLSKDLGSRSIILTMAGGLIGEIFWNDYLSQLNLPGTRVDANKFIAQVILNVNQDDVLGIMSDLWHIISTSSANEYYYYDPGMMETKVPSIKVANNRAYSCRYYVDIDFTANTINLQKCRWHSRIGSSEYFANYLGRSRGASAAKLYWHADKEMYGSLSPYIRDQKKFEDQLDQLLVLETQYLIARLEAAGFSLSGLGHFEIDLMWAQKDNAIYPVVEEAGISVCNDENDKWRLI